MNFNSELLFFLSAIGAFNGLILGVYIFIVEGRKHIGNKFLSIALLTLSIRAGKSVLFYFNDNLFELFIQTGIVACLFIGPFIYFFVYTVCHPQHQPPNWKRHLFVLIPVILVLTILFPYYEYRDLWSSLLRSIYFLWLAYILLSVRILIPTIRQSQQNNSILKPTIKWTIHVFLGFSLVWVAYFTCAFTSYIVGAMTFSVILYLLILFLFFTKKKQIFLLQKASLTLHKKEQQKSIIKEMDILFVQDEVYKQPSIILDDVARTLAIPSYQLSQIINDNLGVNFNTYVNQFRIEAAKKLLSSNPKYTIEGIGQECGFKSKSSFYAAFKAATGTTPSKYV